jgi:hypothetical protein
MFIGMAIRFDNDRFVVYTLLQYLGFRLFSSRLISNKPQTEAKLLAEPSSIDKLGTRMVAESNWPEVGERDSIPCAHGRKIQTQINAVLERARATTGKGRSTAVPRAEIVPLLESMLDLSQRLLEGRRAACTQRQPPRTTSTRLPPRFWRLLPYSPRFPPQQAVLGHMSMPLPTVHRSRSHSRQFLE